LAHSGDGVVVGVVVSVVEGGNVVVGTRVGFGSKFSISSVDTSADEVVDEVETA
jgi:hypothetical protein